MITQPTIIILIGITGDLSKRKLLPAIDALQSKGQLPAQFKLVGITRHDNDQGYFKMDLDNADDYKRLAEHLEKIERELSSREDGSLQAVQRLFYLSVAPTVSLPIIQQLGASGLSKVPNTKLLLEKPFGLDEQNAKDIITEINKYFAPEQQYRIDHYLAKNTVHALAGASSARATAAKAGEIEKLSVIAHESLSIEGRAHFYEQAGALRDFVQSHLLQVAAVALHSENRLAVLRELSVAEPLSDNVKRGQYVGYREAAENPTSMVETFVSVTLQSSGPLYQGKVVVETGKALDRKNTELTIYYKDGATQVISLNDSENAYENVFYDAMNSDKTFFVTPEEVLQTWHILTPIQEAWAASDNYGGPKAKDSTDLIFYDPGTRM